jgi:hypothetical protein
MACREMRDGGGGRSALSNRCLDARPKHIIPSWLSLIPTFKRFSTWETQRLRAAPTSFFTRDSPLSGGRLLHRTWSLLALNRRADRPPSCLL